MQIYDFKLKIQRKSEKNMVSNVRAEGNMMMVAPVFKANIPETLKKIEKDYSALFRARDFAPLSSVRSAISRLNGQGENYELVKIIDNGESYIIKRN